VKGFSVKKWVIKWWSSLYNSRKKKMVPSCFTHSPGWCMYVGCATQQSPSAEPHGVMASSFPSTATKGMFLPKWIIMPLLMQTYISWWIWSLKWAQLHLFSFKSLYSVKFLSILWNSKIKREKVCRWTLPISHNDVFKSASPKEGTVCLKEEQHT
jgi:hypothetical protein